MAQPYDIDLYPYRGGRMVKEDGTAVNIADLLEQILQVQVGNVQITSDQISDASTTGKQLLTVSDPATGRDILSISVDTLSGATTTGKQLMKATDGATARSAIGAGTPYTLPDATTTTKGGVRQAAFVDPATATPGQIAQAMIDAGLMAGS